MPPNHRTDRAGAGHGDGFFSILSPGKHISLHRGPSRGVLRYPLDLKVTGTADQYGIRVADEVVHWAEGEHGVRRHLRLRSVE